ncbi:DUF3781 domain-containing protein [Flammeovirgaceae bacterium KN852]|uniref:DUF3781 domain-containing protein n=1 Tax=Marinigracilibium pacificum TaxID=2729599 RepID=A0A848IZL8_9BACT|nr:DUF3781 domain-containing protein [Marinigracilibium pacificum]
MNKQLIINKLCYTPLVYQRINKKLATNYTTNEIENLIFSIITNTNENEIIKSGKNYYLINPEYKIRITINSTTFRVITVDKIK